MIGRVKAVAMAELRHVRVTESRVRYNARCAAGCDSHPGEAMIRNWACRGVPFIGLWREPALDVGGLAQYNLNQTVAPGHDDRQKSAAHTGRSSIRCALPHRRMAKVCNTGVRPKAALPLQAVSDRPYGAIA